jgi:hypothetical protein
LKAATGKNSLRKTRQTAEPPVLFLCHDVMNITVWCKYLHRY